MGYIKIQTGSGIRMEASLNSKSDYEKIIKFLQAERDAMPVKPKRSAKDEIVMNIGRGFDAARIRQV